MTSITAKVRSFIESQNLILASDHIAAAVSGGVDSMVMLYILHKLKKELDFLLSIIHVNHGVRGRDSDLDEKLVRETANKLKLNITIERLTGIKKTASEAQLRTSRYDAFEKILQKNNIIKIATAHQLNDQLETFLMRLYTGASLNGLMGIPVKRSGYIRPILIVTRKEIEAFARLNNIEYRTDYTNYQTDKLRNKIRQIIIPRIEEVFGNRFYTGFPKSIEELTNINSEYKFYLQDTFETIATVKEDVIYVTLQSFLELNATPRRHLLVYCIFSFFGLNSYLELKNFRAFESFIKTAKTGSLFYFSERLQAEKNREQLIFYKSTSQSYLDQELFPGKDVKLGRNIISINTVSNDSLKWNKDTNMEFICGDQIQFPLKVGSWKNGDWFIPLGMNKKQKLSDYFVNEKIARFEKPKIPIVRNDDEIIWIAGYRIDERYRVNEGCKNIYRLNLRKENKH
jgi:tRNA(Ile)-lysidine synthase